MTIGFVGFGEAGFTIGSGLGRPPKTYREVLDVISVRLKPDTTSVSGGWKRDATSVTPATSV